MAVVYRDSATQADLAIRVRREQEENSGGPLLGEAFPHNLVLEQDAACVAATTVDAASGKVVRMLGVLHHSAAVRGAIEDLAAVRVLIADDFADWRRCVSAMVNEEPDFQIIGEASDGWEAVEKSKQLQPDLILLDVGMPRLNGIQAARRICATVPQSTILFVSQTECRAVIAEALQTGACTRGYVLKTAAASDLLPAMRAVMKRGDLINGKAR